MAELVVHQHLISDLNLLEGICPFGAIEIHDGLVHVNSACRICKLCIKNGPPGAFELVRDDSDRLDKSQWRGIAVYIDHLGDDIHPVSLELLGKAQELAKKIDHPVLALLFGSNLEQQAADLLHYGIDTLYLYDHPELADFRIYPYTAVFEDFIKTCQPAVVLVGGTPVGRSLAPRTAARFRTGLTADCTMLDIRDNSDLDQIRPAFGGNIMAHIQTPNHRPQFATVRYKIFSAPERSSQQSGKIIRRTPSPAMLAARTETLAVTPKEIVKNIEDSDVLIVAGQGIQKKENLTPLQELADRLGGMVGGTRPVIEAGWLEARRQIGLSGRTVKPKLIITCGVSGSIQFVAGMNGSDHIMAINTDPDAPIFNVAHTAIVGDACEIVPALVKKINSKS